MRRALCILPVLILTSCGRQPNNIVSQHYVHPYGVEIKRSDWICHGKSGKITELVANGVFVTKTYKEGVLDGEALYTFANSSIVRTKELYDSGVLVSRVHHYESGVPSKEEVYQDNTLSRVTVWYENGTPALLETYQRGRLYQGEYRNINNETESKVVAGEGIRSLRDSQGVLESKETFEQGFLKEKIQYFANGDPSSITRYLNDKIHGVRLTFLAHGVPLSVEEWVNGMQEGETITYQNGQKYAQIPYVRGQKHGLEIRYRNGKEVAEEISWKRGDQHGFHKIYDGSSVKTQWYHRGEFVSKSTYDRLNIS